MNYTQPLSYADARKAFLDAVGQCEAAIVQQTASPHSGPDGEPLFVDVARIGSADATRLLVLVSGTHGVEGHCGSMIQTHLLSSRTFLKLPLGLAVLIIHAINPYGFAWNRRVTFEGVDLNRNFVDFTASLPENRQFNAELADLLAPSPEQRAEADSRLAAWLMRTGEAARKIIAGGQFVHPAAPFYGGKAPTWSRSVFEGIVSANLRRARSICLIDYHTGLGLPGRGQLIGTTNASETEIASAQAIWGSAFVPAGGMGSVSYHLAGDLIGAVPRIIPNARYISAAHEFGTVDEVTVTGALRDDHGAHRIEVQSAIRAARDAMMDAFFPSDPAWAGAVKNAAVSAVVQALDRSDLW